MEVGISYEVGEVVHDYEGFDYLIGNLLSMEGRIFLHLLLLNLKKIRQLLLFSVLLDRYDYKLQFYHDTIAMIL